MTKIHKEQEEFAAVIYIANGNGSWPVPEDHRFAGKYDEVHVAIPIDDPLTVSVFLRKNGETLQEYKYELRRILQDEETGEETKT